MVSVARMGEMRNTYKIWLENDSYGHKMQIVVGEKVFAPSGKHLGLQLCFSFE
jgi:hypothetical protein